MSIKIKLKIVNLFPIFLLQKIGSKFAYYLPQIWDNKTQLWSFYENIQCKTFL